MLAVLAYRTAAGLARVLPAPVADRLAVALARLAFGLNVPARTALERNLARVLPAGSRAEHQRHARQAFEHFARAFSRFLRPIASATSQPEILGAEHLAAARSSGKGVILLSAHFGDWEGGAAFLASQGLPVHLAARAQPDPRIEQLFAARRAARGVRVLARGATFPGAAAALRRREWIALMADRGTANSGGPSVCAWAAALAGRTGAIVLPVVFVRTAGGRPALCVEAPLSPERCRDGAFRDTMGAWLARWPEQWAAFAALPDGLV